MLFFLSLKVKKIYGKLINGVAQKHTVLGPNSLVRTKTELVKTGKKNTQIAYLICES